MSATLVTGWDRPVPASTAAIRAAVAEAASRYEEAYIVIEKADQEYMQTWHEIRGFILEKREGGPDRHYKGESLTSQSMREFPAVWERLLEIGPRRSRHFTADEIVAAFTAFVDDRPEPATIGWRKIEV